jgi:hypothetical protein
MCFIGQRYSFVSNRWFQRQFFRSRSGQQQFFPRDHGHGRVFR